MISKNTPISLQIFRQQLVKRLKNLSLTPDVDADLILSQILQKPRTYIYTHSQVGITSHHINQIEQLLKSLKKSEPIEYLLHSKQFMGEDYYVNSAVLIPRNETEELVERALKTLNFSSDHTPSVLEIGTGSGCISISLASHCSKQLHIDSLEKSRKAAAIARLNSYRLLNAAQRHRLNIINTSVFSWKPSRQYDLLISNPPYIPNHEIAYLPASVRNFEPKIALIAGKDGLIFYKKLASLINSNLKETGIALFEIHSLLAVKTKFLFEHSLGPEWEVRVVKDLSGRDRILEIKKG